MSNIHTNNEKQVTIIRSILASMKIKINAIEIERDELLLELNRIKSERNVSSSEQRPALTRQSRIDLPRIDQFKKHLEDQIENLEQLAASPYSHITTTSGSYTTSELKEILSTLNIIYVRGDDGLYRACNL